MIEHYLYHYHYHYLSLFIRIHSNNFDGIANMRLMQHRMKVRNGMSSLAGTTIFWEFGIKNFSTCLPMCQVSFWVVKSSFPPKDNLMSLALKRTGTSPCLWEFFLIIFYVEQKIPHVLLSVWERWSNRKLSTTCFIKTTQNWSMECIPWPVGSTTIHFYI